jgi:hypothetical protein
MVELSGSERLAADVNASFSVRKEAIFPMSEREYLISTSILIR